MDPSGSVYLSGGDVVAVVGGRPPIPLNHLAARIVATLSKRTGGATGSQLAQELSVTPAAITKATADLVDLGIIRKEPLPVARNVKLYFIAVTVVDEEVVKKLRKEMLAAAKELNFEKAAELRDRIKKLEDMELAFK